MIVRGVFLLVGVLVALMERLLASGRVAVGGCVAVVGRVVVGLVAVCGRRRWRASFVIYLAAARLRRSAAWEVALPRRLRICGAAF